MSRFEMRGRALDTFSYHVYVRDGTGRSTLVVFVSASWPTAFPTLGLGRLVAFYSTCFALTKGGGSDLSCEGNNQIKGGGME
jgi:hypothetical protein